MSFHMGIIFLMPHAHALGRVGAAALRGARSTRELEPPLGLTVN